MVIPRDLIDNNYLRKEQLDYLIFQDSNSFEYKIFDVLAKSFNWFLESPLQTTQAFLDAYYIVTLSLMRPHPEFWCNDFFKTSGLVKDKDGKYHSVKERQTGIMSIVYCVLKCLDDPFKQTKRLNELIYLQLEKKGGIDVIERMLYAVGKECKPNRSWFSPIELSLVYSLNRIDWHKYINPFHISGKYVSNDITLLLNVIGSGKPIYDIPCNCDNYKRVLGKVERLRVVEELKKLFERERKNYLLEHDSSQPELNYKELMEILNEYYYELKMWIDGEPHWDDKTNEYADDVKKAQDEEHDNSLEYNCPPWLNLNNWPTSLTIEAFEFYPRLGDAIPAPSVINPTKKNKRIKNFREFVKEKERTEEIIKKLHLLIGNMRNTRALKIITRAWWIDWLNDKPTATSIRLEFPSINCSDQYISTCLREPKPTKNGKVDEKAIERIRSDYEAI